MKDADRLDFLGLFWCLTRLPRTICLGRVDPLGITHAGAGLATLQKKNFGSFLSYSARLEEVIPVFKIFINPFPSFSYPYVFIPTYAFISFSTLQKSFSNPAFCKIVEISGKKNSIVDIFDCFLFFWWDLETPNTVYHRLTGIWKRRDNKVWDCFR